MADTSATDGGIDTTPVCPRPPAPLIDAAERDIPVVLSDVHPEHDGTIELVAAFLVGRLQTLGHSLAAAQWAVHTAVRAGRLRPGLVVIGLPAALVTTYERGGWKKVKHGGGAGR